MSTLRFNFLIIILLPLFGIAQNDTLYYLYEDFEAAEADIEWISYSDEYERDWGYAEGGHDYNPSNAKSGSKNALYYWSEVVIKPTAMLVSPPINLSLARKPLLSFGHSMRNDWSTDELYLLFRAGAEADWDTIAYYNTPTMNPNDPEDVIWMERNFNIIDEGDDYLVDDFQIAFLGIANAGYGICIDSVVVAEKDTIPKFIRTLETRNEQHDLIPEGATDVPLFMAGLEVMGNNGTAIFESVQFTSASTSDNLFEPGSFKLYLTRNDVYGNEENNKPALIADGASISNGVVSFSELDTNLNIGFNYLWLVADISNTANYNDNISFYLNTDAILIADSSLPTVPSIATQANTVYDTKFFDNFETSSGNWILEQDFEIGKPLGLEINGAKDPDLAYSDTSVLGTDLSINGGYETSIVSAYYATTPTIDLTYFDNVKINFREWISFFSIDEGVIEISNNNGLTWKRIWYSPNDAQEKDSKWEETTLTEYVNDSLSHQSQVKIRFGIKSSSTLPYGGFAIDNFAVVGNHLEVDLGIEEIISPFEGCLYSGNDTVIVKIRNYAEAASPSGIPVYYGLWGADSTIVRDTISGSIAKDGYLIYKFSTLANFPQPDIYNKFFVGVDVQGDEDADNDTLTKYIRIPDNIDSESLVDFEYKGGIWKKQEGSVWSARTPDASIGSVDGSVKAWVSSPFGDYVNGDTSFISSGCYDLTFANRNIVRFKYWIQSQLNHDGFVLQYSTDQEQTWTKVDSSIFAPYGSWYNSYISSLESGGFSGTSNSWDTAFELLPAHLAWEPNVKFRVLWASDNDVNAAGMAFDDFEIFPAPPDIGVTSIITPIDACQGTTTADVSLYIENYGYNNMNVGDTILVGVNMEVDSMVVDTLILSSILVPGDSVFMEVPFEYDILEPGVYSLKAYIMNESELWYEISDNDTANYTFTVWQNPIITLADTIGSRQPDTVNIVPVYENWVEGYTYSWSPGVETDSIYDVSTHGFGDSIYHITVTEPVHGCYTVDSVNVLLLYFDVGADTLFTPFSDCKHSEYEQVKVGVKNKGTDSLLVGDKLEVHCRVDGGTIYNDTITLAEVLRANQIVEHTMPVSFNLSDIDSYFIEVWASYLGGDEKAINDSISETIYTYGFTSMDLGGDAVVKALDYSLDAGGGFDIYTWNTGDTTRTINIDSSGTYWIEAGDPNGCPSRDTVDVWFKIRDVEPIAMLAPVTSCDRPANEAVQIRILNNGTDTITTSDNIVFNYTVNGGAKVEETASPLSSILPGATYVHTFSTLGDFSSYIDYNLALTASAVGDLHPENDSIADTVKTSANPHVDFGFEEKTVKNYSYVLDAGAGDNFEYLWSDGSKNQILNAAQTKTYSVLVTDTLTGCAGGDTVELTFDILDYAMQSVNIGAVVCQGNETGVEVEVQNNGNLARAGTSFTLGFFLNDNDSIEEEIIIPITSPWLPTQKKKFTISNPVPFTEVGTTNYTFYLKHADDLRDENNTIQNSVSVNDAPDVAFDGQTLEVQLPYVLNPGQGFSAWQWSDGSSSPTLTVNSAGNYSVTVFSATGCPGTGTVQIIRASSISDYTMDNLWVEIFPNPANDMLHIKANLLTGDEMNIELFNVNGQAIFREVHSGWSEYSRMLDVKSLPKGVYVVRFSNSDIYRVDRIVVR